MRFVAVHGRAGFLGGNAAAGLEGWAYPLQIFSNFCPEFQYAGSSSAIASTPLLRRIEYAPDSVERTYVGPDFVIHEKLFVPRDLPGAVITYTVESVRAIQIVVRFKPVLNLMWPVAIGGQQVRCVAASKAYLLDEPTRRFAALVGSPDAVLHDDLPNTNAPTTTDQELAITLRAAKNVSVFMACDPADPAKTSDLYHRLATGAATLEAEAESSYHLARTERMQVETPDPEVNKALAWSDIALDQAWVCNPTLSCGLVAGYGPSRGLARRPQYDWFFAGDALVTIRSLLLTGNFQRSKDALLFLMKYQDQTTGMMWHELSQSASYVDWAGSYPYMFPHVDITFDYLDVLAKYVEASGDTAFVREHWASIEAAFHYCESIIDPADGLPRVPKGKEGSDEQDQPREELSLATEWVKASEGFSKLAAIAGHKEAAHDAHRASLRAAAAIAPRFWDPTRNFWIAGFSGNGKPQPQMRSRPLSALTLPIFTEAQTSSVLDTLSSSQFETDWGTRGVGSASKGFNPTSYATGSVWATSTASTATALWQHHRPLAAWDVWRTLLPWAKLDSMGHFHETLSGTSFQPQVESVPEQTWSSAMFLSSFVEGLLGIEQDGTRHRLVFAPHLPAEWNHLSVKNVRVGETKVQFVLNRNADSLDLDIESSGPNLDLQFAPSLPLGATLGLVTVDGKPVNAALEPSPSETQVKVLVPVDGNAHRVHLTYRDGIETSVPAHEPAIGQTSSGMKVIHASLRGSVYTLLAEVQRPLSGSEPSNNIVVLNTRRSVKAITGGRVMDHVGNRYRIALDVRQHVSYSNPVDNYVPAMLTVEFSEILK